MATTSQSKRALFDRMYASGAHVRVVLDARCGDVVVPEPYGEDFGLVLDYGFTLPKPTQDLLTSDRGVSATLSFGNVPQITFIPWVAVYAIVGSNEGRSWEEDVPREAAAKALDERVAARAPAQAAPKPRHLRSVD